ncbi:Armadillo repeat-containing protein 8 [Portunus trituberculatus]|uniref:Armadillo repeat-containing protein 8 n=1 Tax=Portunus trituberculatus TaxID=210409 RepID=A0A5B7G4U1_PORTR|nr:Armadillo repeat-containing protein 8 [Portunus trituberculatus]
MVNLSDSFLFNFLFSESVSGNSDRQVSILHHLGTDQIFRLLSDTDVHILMKTLGLLRNLLSTKGHIDQIMQCHGKEIMQAIILILEGEHSAEVKEQALCILANIADGDIAKSAIMSNEDVLKKLMNYMGSDFPV